MGVWRFQDWDQREDLQTVRGSESAPQIHALSLNHTTRRMGLGFALHLSRGLWAYAGPGFIKGMLLQ